MRRSRAKLATPVLCLEKEGKPVGELRRRHHIGADGFYRGTRYFQPKATAELDEDDN